MSYLAHTLPNLRGLNLRNSPGAVAEDQVIDALDVDLVEGGLIRSRDQWKGFVPRAANSVFVHDEDILLGTSDGLYAYNIAGTELDDHDTGGMWGFARYGDPNDEVTYCGTGTQPLVKWDGSDFEVVTDSPEGSCLAVTQYSNRLVVAGFTETDTGPDGEASSEHHVYFSEPGDPETWEPDNFVQLTPGDGEKIVAMVSWGEHLFVFKQTKFFVFTGENVQDDGVVFDYFPVATGKGTISPHGVSVTSAGVVFVDSTGVYLTTGGAPVSLSDDIEPVFQREASPFFTGGQVGSLDTATVVEHDHRIYFSYATQSVNDRTFVFDTKTGGWVLYSFGMTGADTYGNDLIYGGGVQTSYTGNPVITDFSHEWTFETPNYKTTINVDGGDTVLVVALVGQFITTATCEAVPMTLIYDEGNQKVWQLEDVTGGTKEIVVDGEPNFLTVAFAAPGVNDLAITPAEYTNITSNERKLSLSGPSNFALIYAQFANLMAFPTSVTTNNGDEIFRDVASTTYRVGAFGQDVYWLMQGQISDGSNIYEQYALNLAWETPFGTYLFGPQVTSYEDLPTAHVATKFTDLGSPHKKHIRENKVWGRGDVRVGVTPDYKRTPQDIIPITFDESGNPVWGEVDWGEFIWGADRDATGQLRRYDTAGTTFSTFIAGRGRWGVYRIDHHLRNQRILSVT